VRKLGLALVELAEAILPFGFETTGDETVVRIDSAIAALRPLSLVVCAFYSEAPLRKRAVVISFKLLGRCPLRPRRLPARVQLEP
jgi:hypothetical protein